MTVLEVLKAAAVVETPTIDPLEEIPTLPEEPKQPSEINKFIDDVIDLLDRDGWNKGHLISLDGGSNRCVVGALSYTAVGKHSYNAYYKNDIYREVLKRLNYKLTLISAADEDRVVLFNDRSTTTKQDIMDLLNSAKDKE